MNRFLSEQSGLSRCDVDYLRKVEQTLPLLADLWHSDLLLYVPGPQPNTAIVIAQASPHTTSPVFSSPLVGKQVGKKNEPLVFQTFRRERTTRGPRCLPSAAVRTAKEVHPVQRQDGKIIGVLAIEADLAEHERLKRKSHVLREALAVILDMAIAGQIDGAGTLTAVREHDGLVVVDGTGEIQYASRIAEALFHRIGYSGSLLGITLQGVDREEGLLFEALECGKCIERENASDNLTWITRVIPLAADDTSWLSRRFKANPRYGGAFIVVDDVTEERQQEQALRIKSAMIQEIHHRVKNNLQTIAALLRLQARRTGIPEVAGILGSSINRILSIAVVHEFLSHDQESVINITEVCQRILDEVTRGIIDPSKSITLRLEGANLYLPAQQATSCALIVNELLQNAVKHGYAERSAGTVVVRLSEHGEELCIEIADDGAGVPGPFDRSNGGHLGLQIINTLVKEDLKGQFEFANGQGVTARVTFPKVAAPPRRSQA